ncbi:MAG: competence/damage-inducible protein A [Vulcanimicrobiaceae bacterium]
MASVELIAVGTELLLGQLTDTNTAYIASHIADIGIDVFATHTVGDNRARITAAITASLARADGVIMTGGLGPTVDDLTKESVCDALGVDDVLHEPSLQSMQAMFASLGREMRENNRKQGMLPRGAQVLENPNGTAPGFLVFAKDGKFVACMPGVPREMKPMLEEHLIPALCQRFSLKSSIYTRIIRCISIAESEIDHRIGDIFAKSENPKIAVLAHDSRIDVKLMAKADSRAAAEAIIAPLQQEVITRLSGHVYGTDAATLESAIFERLRARHLRLASAESCTGGRIAAAVTAIAGASDVFVGGIVAYDNVVKEQQLGVDAALVRDHGVVSEPVVLAMASGARSHFGVDVAVATTGIAGPSGGTSEKPVGTVWIAVDIDGIKPEARCLHLRGDRQTIQARATTATLALLWRHLSPSP